MKLTTFNIQDKKNYTWRSKWDAWMYAHDTDRDALYVVLPPITYVRLRTEDLSCE